MTARAPRLNLRVLTVFLLVSLPAVAVGGAMVLAVGQARLSDSYGAHLEALADQTVAGVDAYVYRRALDVSLLARAPDLRREAALASARPFDRAKADALDLDWQQGGTPPEAATALLASPASRYLADLVGRDRIYRELLLTDRHGRLVAASNRTSDYFQADEDWWSVVAGEGRVGPMSVSDVRWDASAGVHAIEIAVPIADPASDALVGVLKAVTDSREMLALVGKVQLGTTGLAYLLRPNGSVVYGTGVRSTDARFFAAEAVADRATTLRENGAIGRDFFEAPAPDGSTYIVGLAQSQLSETYPNLAWLVAVSQSREELLAPVNSLGWYLLVAVVSIAAIVLAVALWFSMRLAAPHVDVDMELVQHPRLSSHVGEEEVTGQAVRA